MPNIFSYYAASSFPLCIRALPSGTSPLMTYEIKCEKLCLLVDCWYSNSRIPGVCQVCTYTADLLGDGVGSLVSAAEHHFVDDDLLGSQDDSILANNSANGAIVRVWVRGLDSGETNHWILINQHLLTLMSRLPSQHTQPGSSFPPETGKRIRNRTTLNQLSLLIYTVNVHFWLSSLIFSSFAEE